MLIIDKRLVINILKISWLGVAFLVLVITLFFFDGRNNSDIEDFLVYSMLLLTFPIGIIASGLVFVVLYFFVSALYIEEITFNVGYVYLIFEWLFLLIVGYIQWFFLIPIIYRKHKDINNYHG